VRINEKESQSSERSGLAPGAKQNMRTVKNAVPEAGRLLLVGADLIDGTGAGPIRDAMVLIERDRIAHAGPRDGRFDSMAATRLDVAGKTLIPGLIEAHTHASFDADMLAYLKNGITTIRFAGLRQSTVARLRERIEHGELRGPRILSCGPMIDQPPTAYPEWSIEVDTPAAAAVAAERLIRENEVEFLIVTQRVTAPVMRAVIEVAHAHGRSVIGQTWEVNGREAAELGIDELHNSSRVYVSRAYPAVRLLRYRSVGERLALSGRAWASINWEATRPIMQAMIDRGISYCGMQVITEFQAGEGVTDLEADADFIELFGETERRSFLALMGRLQEGWTAEDLDQWKVANRNRLEWMQRYRDMGGILLPGTDMQFGGIMYHQELSNLARIGLSFMDILVAATGQCARALGLGERLGTIETGQLADIVVLNRDPLGDLGALRDISCVIKDGIIQQPLQLEQGFQSSPGHGGKELG
jgi:hypothetical protein